MSVLLMSKLPWRPYQVCCITDEESTAVDADKVMPAVYKCGLLHRGIKKIPDQTQR